MIMERFLSQEDATVLSRLAEQLLRVREVKINSAEKLIDLIATSILLPENAQRTDCVALCSKVTYRVIGSNDCHSMFIVCPQDANDSLAQVSILAPLAMSLLGRPAGSVIEVALPFDRIQLVEIVDVEMTPSGGIAPAGRNRSPAAAGLAQL